MDSANYSIEGNDLELQLIKNEFSNISQKGNWNILNFIATLSMAKKHDEEIPLILYLPTEVNFKKYKPESVKKLEKRVQFGTVLNSETISSEIKDFFNLSAL